MSTNSVSALAGVVSLASAWYHGTIPLKPLRILRAAGRSPHLLGRAGFQERFDLHKILVLIRHLREARVEQNGIKQRKDVL